MEVEFALQAEPLHLDESDHGSRIHDRIFAVSATLVAGWALVQNLYRLGSAEILADEPTYVKSAWAYVHGKAAQPPAVSRVGGQLVAVPGNFEHPPLAKLLFGLAQIVMGSPDGLTAARFVSGACTLLAGLVAFVWISRSTGRWTGLLAAAFLTVLPQTASGSDGRFDRFAMLDPTASFFMVLSVALAWEWARRDGRAGWLFAELTGIAIGCASGAKENGFLGAVGPVALTVLFAVRDKRVPLIRGAQSVAAICTSVVVFASLYLPLGNPIVCIRYLIGFQSDHAGQGHLIGYAGHVSMMAPWWVNFWFLGHGYGPWLTFVLAAGAMSAVAIRRDRLVSWCVAGLAAPVLFHCFMVNVALGYYWVMWTPLFLVLAALGIAAVAEKVAPRFTMFVAMAALACPLVASVGESVNVATMRPRGVAVLGSLMTNNGLSGPIVVAGLPSWALEYYLPTTPLITSTTSLTAGAASDTSPKLIAVGTPQCRTLIDQSVRALVAVNLAVGHVRRIYSDSQITVYEVTTRLTLPSKAQVAAIPPGSLTDDC